MIVDLADIAIDLRPDIGVGDDGRAALEFAIFLRQLVARRDEHAGVARLEQRLGALLVIGVAIAMEKEDRHRLDADRGELCSQLLDVLVDQRRLDLAIGEDALIDLEAQRALDQRLVLLEEEIVGIRPVDAADLVNVAKAFGNDERGVGAFALEDRVDGNGRAVEEEADIAVIGLGLGDAVVDALDQPLGGREGLAEGELAARLVEHGDIGKGAADIGGQSEMMIGHE